MSKFKNIPMRVPRIGGNNQPPTVDVSQAVQKKCTNKIRMDIPLGSTLKDTYECECEYFDMVFKIYSISKLAPGNTTNQDIVKGIPVYLCHKCGQEWTPLGSEESNDDTKGK